MSHSLEENIASVAHCEEIISREPFSKMIWLVYNPEKKMCLVYHSEKKICLVFHSLEENMTNLPPWDEYVICSPLWHENIGQYATLKSKYEWCTSLGRKHDSYTVELNMRPVKFYNKGNSTIELTFRCIAKEML